MLRARTPQPENTQLEKIMETLKLLGLSYMEQRTAVGYLKGEAGETVFRRLSQHDMIQVPGNIQRAAYAIFDDYCMQKQYAEAGRYFKLLYALYGSSLGECLYNYSRFCSVVESGELQVDASITLTVFAQCMVPRVYVDAGQVVSRRYLQSSDLELMAELVKYDLRVVRQAIKDFKEKYFDVKMVLYTLYFYLRSSRVDL
ncbi:MAG: hypothetical protein K2O34_06445, partial [Acetatifactor sp.]|nr:hypothetical protein [Acetatifactor sp.]